MMVVRVNGPRSGGLLADAIELSWTMSKPAAASGSVGTVLANMQSVGNSIAAFVLRPPDGTDQRIRFGWSSCSGANEAPFPG